MANPLERIQLFTTVKNLHDAGTVDLTPQERRQIEAETADLIKRSIRNKTAMKTPEGFEEILEKLRDAKDADEAFTYVADFLKDKGIIESEGHEEREEEIIEDIEGKTQEFRSEEKSEEKEDGGDKKDIDLKGVTPPSGFPPKKEKGLGEGSKKGPGKKDEKDEKDETKNGEKPDEMKEARRELIRRAMDQERGRKDIRTLQDKKKEKEESEISAAEMGVEEAEVTTGDLMATARAKKIKIAITPERNLVAQHEDYGPVFYAEPHAAVKRDLEALRRLANKVYGVAVYKGFKVAAQLCNTKLLRTAGVDEGVELDSDKEVAPKSEGILSDSETDAQEQHTDDSDSSLPGNEVDTREKPPTVTDVKTDMIKSGEKKKALAKSRARFKATKSGRDILEMAENVTKDGQPTKPSGNTQDEAVNDEQAPEPKPSNDVLSEADDDIRHSTARNLRDLYKKRAEKHIAAEKEAFIRKFTRAIRIAAARMALNHDEHPMKVAVVDVLTAGDISFSSGEKYASMDLGTAVELTELIASEGHDQFVGRLLSKAADLLEKSDDYLTDVEADLKELAPVPVGGEVSHIAKSSSRNRRSARVRRDAAEGNFTKSKRASSTSMPAKRMSNNTVREALSGGTALGKRLGRARTLS